MALFDPVVLGVFDRDSVLSGAMIFQNGRFNENIIAGRHGDGAAKLALFVR